MYDFFHDISSFSLFLFYVGELKETKAYQKWAKKVSQMKPPTSPLRRKGKWVLYWVFSVHIKDIYLSLLWCKSICPFFLSYNRSIKQSESDLFAIISQRRNERKDQFDSMFSSMVSKYGGNADSEPTEEEFEAAQRKVESRKASNKSKRKWY